MARVLVIDDDRALLQALRTGLSALGYEVSAAMTGEDGLSKSDQRRCFSGARTGRRGQGRCAGSLGGPLGAVPPHGECGSGHGLTRSSGRIPRLQHPWPAPRCHHRRCWSRAWAGSRHPAALVEVEPVGAESLIPSRDLGFPISLRSQQCGKSGAVAWEMARQGRRSLPWSAQFCR